MIDWLIKSYIDPPSRESMRNASYCDSQLPLVFELILTWFELVSLCSRALSVKSLMRSHSHYLSNIYMIDLFFCSLHLFLSMSNETVILLFIYSCLLCFKSLSYLNSEITIYVLDLLSFENYVNWLSCVFFRRHFMCFIVFLSFREISKLI